ncbi:MAG TPA: type II secretion system protein GspK [Opitutaceae bacterium]|nr:type II secretion system protein GspK [Opitutaceae bacterium]
MSTRAQSAAMTTARPVRGSILIIVLWICFGLVALVLYFAHGMSSELRSADNRFVGLSAREAADGGTRYVAYVLSQYATGGTRPLSTDYEAEALPVGDATFWILGREADLEPTDEPVFNLIDEASKINLNTASRAMLEALPEMTPELAGAILDWRDTNTTVGENGAEDETYSRLDPPRRAKNAPFETIDELRLVYGATLDLLFGEDLNRNGVLDPNEDDGDATPPLDDHNGLLRRGLLDFLTVYSAQPNTRSDGSRRIDISSLAGRPRLNQLLVERFGETRAGELMAPLEGQTLGSVAEFMVRSRITASEFDRVQGDLTTSAAAVVRGLININSASETVLSCIPGIGPDKARALVSYRLSHPEGLTSISWLLEALDAPSIVQAGPFITGQSYQYSADIVAVGPHGRGYARIRSVFDLSQGSARMLFRQDLTGLGWALGPIARDVAFAP